MSAEADPPAVPPAVPPAGPPAGSSPAELDALAERAGERLARGGRRAAARLAEEVLRHDPDHPRALTVSAGANAADDLDVALQLFRRADAVRGPRPEEYLQWIGLLAGADPPRQLAAADMARRVRDRFPDRPDLRCAATLWLARSGDLTPAPAAVEELTSDAVAGTLDDDTAVQVLQLTALLLDEDGPWAGGYPRVAPRIDRLVADDRPHTVVEAARIALTQGDFRRVQEHLERLDRTGGVGRLHPRVQPDVALIRALVAATYDRHDEALRLFDELPALNDDQQLVRAQALHGLGLLTEATAECEQLRQRVAAAAGSASEAARSAAAAAAALRPAPETAPGPEPGRDRGSADDAVRRDRAAERAAGRLAASTRVEALRLAELLLRVELLRAAVDADLGRHRDSYRRMLAAAATDPAGMSAPMRAAVLAVRCGLLVGDPDRALAELDAIPGERGVREVDRLQVETSRVHALAWLAERRPAYRARAAQVARESVVRVRRQLDRLDPADGDRATLRAQAAYLALHADDDLLGEELLGGLPDTPDNWRLIAMRAAAAMRAGRVDAALELSRDALGPRRHDLERRCTLVLAALLAGEVELATRESEAIVREAPDHTQARLLRAEALALAVPPVGGPDPAAADPTAADPQPGAAAGTGSGDAAGSAADSPRQTARVHGAEDHEQLARVAAEFAHTLRLHEGLIGFLEGRADAGPVGSHLLSEEVVQHVSRQGAHAAVRARHALLRAGLPRDRPVARDGRFLLKRLRAYDADEAARLGRLLGRPAVGRWGRRALRVVTPLLAGFSFLVALGQVPALAHLIADDQQRLVVAGIGLLALFFPYVRKFTFLGVELERGQQVDRLGPSAELLHGGLAAVQRGSARMLTAPTPGAVAPTGRTDRAPSSSQAHPDPLDPGPPGSAAGAGVLDRQRRGPAPA